MNRKLGDVGDDSAQIPSSAFYVEHAAPAEAAGGIASGGHRPQSTMTGGDLLKAEHVTLDVGTHKQLMEDIPTEKRLVLSFPHISAWVPDILGPGAAEGNVFSKAFHKLRGGKPKSGKPKERQILYDISGTCRPGEVLALMGPSGSGKTTLLSILGGRGPATMTMTGHPTFNQEKLTKRAKRSVGFVLQDDLLYETLTVYETLYYAAMLRLPSTMSAEQKVERVDHVIHTLGLNKCKDTIVGGFFQRGISGGERKRVSVGHELLINPSIILLDEPTSGLDSTTAMNLVTSLCQLAAGGRAVVTTIHQPSSRLYQQLDKLLLLSEGHALYYGRANLAAHWFHTLGFTCPYGVNVADFILDVSSGAVNSSKLESDNAVKHLTACSERYAEAYPKEDGYRHPDTLNEEILGTSLWTAARSRKNLGADVPQHMDSIGLDEQADMQTSSSQASSSSQGFNLDEAEKGTRASKTATESRWGASYSLQLRILFIRAIKTRRFDSMSSQDFIQFILVGLLTGLFWWQQGKGDTLYSAQNSNGLLFFEMLFLAFRAMFVALFTFPSEYKMMLKERASGMYRLSAFYFARSASDLPFEATPSLFVFIIYFMGGLRLTPGAFFSNWFATMLVTLVAQSFGLLIGATVMNAKTAQTVTAVVMLTMMLVGGFYVTSIPIWISWLKYLSFVYYGYDLLLKVEYQGRTLWDCAGIPNPPHPSSNPACTAIPPGGLQAKLHLQENTENWPWEAVVLIGWLIFFRYMVYVALRYKTAAPEAKGH